jgi:hypothetical protein
MVLVVEKRKLSSVRREPLVWGERVLAAAVATAVAVIGTRTGVSFTGEAAFQGTLGCDATLAVQVAGKFIAAQSFRVVVLAVADLL